jgi:MoxR-like ATPase
VYFYRYAAQDGERHLLSGDEARRIKESVPNLSEGLKIRIGDKILQVVKISDEGRDLWVPALSKTIDPKPIERWVGSEIFEAISLLYMDGQVALVGEKGTGKNYLCSLITEVFALEYFQIAGSEDVREASIMGSTELRSGETKFVEGILPQWARKGGLLVIDESNMIEPAILMRINEATDFRRQVTVSKSTVIKRHEDSYLTLTLNPTTKTYAGTHNLNLAFLDRFPIITFDLPSMEKEREIMRKKNLSVPEKLHESIEKVRELYRQGKLSNTISTRQVEKFATLSEVVGYERAVRILFINQYMDPDERKIVEGILLG